MSVTDYSKTASSNTAISGTDISEGCSPAGINNAIRQVMADVAEVVDATTALTALAVDNIKVDGNTISSTDTNGDITLDPNGTGDTVIASGNLGVGTSSPTTTSGFENGKFIEVENSGTASDATDNASIQIKSDSRHSLLSLMSNASYSGYINFGDGDDNDVGQIRYNHSNNTLRLRVNGGEVATLNGTGQLMLDGEGGSNLTVNVQQGSTKVWVHYRGTSTQTINDSYNTSSITDGGTGVSTVAINNDMNNANYAFTFGGARSSTPNEIYYAAFNNGILVGSLKLKTFGGSTVTALDC